MTSTATTREDESIWGGHNWTNVVAESKVLSAPAVKLVALAKGRNVPGQHPVRGVLPILHRAGNVLREGTPSYRQLQSRFCVRKIHGLAKWSMGSLFLAIGVMNQHLYSRCCIMMDPQLCSGTMIWFSRLYYTGKKQVRLQMMMF
jgi:hypothetical protein